MKKLNTWSFLLLFFLLCASWVKAQELSWEQKKQVVSTVFSIVNNYENLADPFDEDGRPDEEKVRNFQNLFSPNATIYDNINEVEGVAGTVRSIPEYLNFIRVNHPDGFSVEVQDVFVKYDSAALYNRVNVLVSRLVTFPQGGFFRDTLQLFLRLGLDYRSANISRIEQGGKPPVPAEPPVVVAEEPEAPEEPSPPRDRDKDGIPDKLDECPFEPGPPSTKGCPDSDRDGIADAQDKCPGEAGLARLDGCPDSDGDGIADAQDKCPERAGPKRYDGCPKPALPLKPSEPLVLITPSLSLGMNGLSIENADFAPLGYTNNIEALTYAPEPASESPGFGFGLGVEADYMFRGPEGIGFSGGIHYFSFSQELGIDSFHAEYQRSDFQDRPFRRILSVGEVVENARAGYLFIPLGLVYRKDLSAKLGILVKGGPAIGIPVGFTADYEARADYDALYSFGNGEGEAVPQFNAGEMEPTDWLVLKGRYADGAEYIESRRAAGYDVAADHELNGSADVSAGAGIFGHLRLGVYYRLNEQTALQVGVNALIGSSSFDPAGGYTLTDEIGSYTSLLEWADGVGVSSFGLNVGLTFQLNQ